MYVLDGGIDHFRAPLMERFTLRTVDVKDNLKMECSAHAWIRHFHVVFEIFHDVE
jgi:hypothetical protein